MQISSNNTLPVLAGIRPDTSLRQSKQPPRAAVSPQNQTTSVNNAVNTYQGYRRPPVFVQPAFEQAMSRTGEQAVRTYRDVAQSGDEVELVNRVNVVA